MINVGRLQPDMIFISQKQKRICLLELCHPIDESPTQLQAAVDRKLQTYAPLQVALQRYPASGWKWKSCLGWWEYVASSKYQYLLLSSNFSQFQILNAPLFWRKLPLNLPKSFTSSTRPDMQRFTLKKLFQWASLPTTLVGDSELQP
jgi:hypothetical protein